MGNFIINGNHFECVSPDYVREYRTLGDLCREWEDVPKMYPNVLPKKVQEAVQAWVNAQDMPINRLSVTLHKDDSDADGYYEYAIWGYIYDNNIKNRVGRKLDFRLKEKFQVRTDMDFPLDVFGIKPKEENE